VTAVHKHFDVGQRWSTRSLDYAWFEKNTTWEKRMMRLIAFAVVALAITVSAQAMPVAPIQGPDVITTQAAYGCGPGMTRVAGVCVARTTKRQARRCIRWTGGVCAAWRYY
jgi:hypothetical protein